MVIGAKLKPASTKLKEHQNLEIVVRYAAGAYQQDIAEEYGITQGWCQELSELRYP